MTYPKPGEILLTDPSTGDVTAQQWDHVDMNEYGAVCEAHDEIGSVRKTAERVKYPRHRVVSIRHQYEDNDGGSREYMHPDDDEWGDTDD